ncbi:MAG: YggS family pyridoxal phosphate-dependent enzyme [Geitlerinemataceae cyanobacterium]
MNTQSFSISDKIQEINQQLTPDIRLIAVTKKVSVEKIREAYAAGIRDFGENRVQEALEKQEQLQDLNDICWHFIGHLQTNKAKQAVESMDWIHTVDSLRILQRLNKLAGELNKKPKICLQVKMLPDPDKYGWLPDELLAACPELEAAEHLDIQGLMTILPLGLSDSEIFEAFQETQKFKDKINQTSQLQVQELSMGMSGDYLLAIQAGATMIRVGRSIFGDR